MFSSLKMKYVIYCFIISIFASAQSVHALTSGGLFGEYFTRIVTPCGANNVVSGFSTVPATYGSPFCTTYNDILSSVLGTGVAPVGQALIGFNSDGTPKYGVVDISAYQTIVDLKAQITLLENRITTLETKVNPTNGSCGGLSNSCTAGSATGYLAGSCGGNKTWSCLGTNGGTPASCSLANPACAVNGVCGGSSSSCNAGSPSGYNAGSCGGSQTWSCLGSGGGSNASCNIANPACAVPINGVCGGSSNSCNAGSPSGYNAGSCGGSQTWSCLGTNGGSSASCNIANPSCTRTGVCGGALPANAHTTASSWTQTWNGSAWTPSVNYGYKTYNECNFVCDTGYAWNGAGACIYSTFSNPRWPASVPSSGMHVAANVATANEFCNTNGFIAMDTISSGNFAGSSFYFPFWNKNGYPNGAPCSDITMQVACYVATNIVCKNF